MNLYIINTEDDEHIATVVGESNEACEAKATEMFGDTDRFEWTYNDRYSNNTNAEVIAA